MTLRRKTLLVVGLTVAALMVILHLTAHELLLRGFRRIEEQSARRDVTRGVDALANEITGLNTKVGDWAKWDDTYAFVEDHNQAFITSNLTDVACNDLRLNLILVVHASGRIVYRKGFDLVEGRDAPLPLAFQQDLAADDWLLRQLESTPGVTGILDLPEGPMLIAAQPILTSQGEGPARGAFIMGRYLDEPLVQKLSELTHVELKIRRIEDADLPVELRAGSATVADDSFIALRAVDDQRMLGYRLLQDVRGTPALVLQVSLPREIYRQGQMTSYYLVLSVLAAGLVCGALTLVLIERLVVSRVSKLGTHVGYITAAKDLTARASVAGSDELADLARGINMMLEMIQRSGEVVRETQRAMETLLSNLPGMAYRCRNDAAWTMEFVSEGCAELTGHPPADLVGNAKLAFSELIHPEDRQTVWDQTQAAVEGRRPFQLLYRIATAAGAEKWVWEQGRGVFGPDGELLALEGFIADISARKRAEEVLAARMQGEKAVAACSKALLNEADNEDALTEALQHLQEYSGACRVVIFENMEQEGTGVVVHPTHEVCVPGVASMLDNPALQALRYECGFERWRDALTRGEAIVGPVEALPPIERDFLRALGNRSVLVLPLWVAGAWFGSIGFDDTRTARVWNDEDVRLLQTGAEMIGAYLERRRARIETQTANARLRRSLRRERQAAVQLEAAMQQLAAAMEDAQTANRAKSEFLANMSHELRTPMTAILGYLELMLEACPGQCACGRDVLQQYGGVIGRNAQHLLQIINDILDLSKIEAGKLQVETLRCPTLQIVNETASLMQARATAKGITLRIECLGPIPASIETDPTRLRQILINLVGNAIKFTEQGGVRLVARFVPGASAAAGGVMQFDVIDTGIGLTAEQQTSLFEAFVQADASAARRFGGTGLGLAISKRLAGMLGGQLVLVDSQPGRGTCFRLTIETGDLAGTPFVEGPELAQLAKSPAAEEKPVPASDEPLHCRVLLVEDGVDNQRLLQFVLKRAGAEVTLAANGQLGVDEFRSAIREGRPFDLVLMDMQMPVMDGYEATRVLRAEGATVPIVALTAHAMAGDRALCVKAGCNEYVSKPIDQRRLIATVREQLAAQRPANPVAAIQQALAEQNLTALAASAHQLQNAAGVQNFPSVYERAAQLEESATARRDLAELERQVRELVELCRAAFVSEPAAPSPLPRIDPVG